MTIKAIIAIGKNGEIGQEGDLPWGRNLPKDLAHFKEETLGQIVVMGNNTFKSLPFEEGFPNRQNMVLSKQTTKEQWDVRSPTLAYCSYGWLEWFIETHLSCNPTKDIYIVGGASVYKQLEPYVEEWIITQVDESFPEADAYFEPDLTCFEDQLKYKDVSGEKYSAIVSYWKK